MAQISISRLGSAAIAGLALALAIIFGDDAVTGAAQRPVKRAPCAMQPDEAFTMFVPLGQVRFFGDADLMLNNRGQQERVVQPRWYVEGQGLVAGPLVTLPPSKMDFYPIQKLLPTNVQLARVTGLELGYVAKSREVWAQAVMKPNGTSQISQSMDTPFSMRTDFKSSRLQAALPLSATATRILVSLANTSDQEIEVVLNGSIGNEKLKLPARSGELISRPVPPKARIAGQVTVETTALPGALRATGFVFDEGKLLLARFVDAATAQEEDLYAGGVPVRGRKVRITLANASSAAFDATVMLLDPATGAPLYFGPTIGLEKGGTAAFEPDLSRLPAGVDRVTLKVDGNGEKGSLVGALHVSNLDTGLSSEVPLRDVGGAKANTGGYPWRLDGDYQSLMHITNVGKDPSRYSARIQIGDFQYVFRTKVVPVGATVTYDIRHLRNAQIPDAYGNVIPEDATSGQFYWSVYNRSPGAHFSGRAEVWSESQRVSSSFSCMMCCDASMTDARLSASSYELGITVDSFLYAERRMEDCYQSVYWEPAYPIDYGVGNTNILGFHDSEIPWVTGLEEGSSGVSATIPGAVYTLIQPEYYEENDHCDEAPWTANPDVGIQTANAVPASFTRSNGGGTTGYNGIPGDVRMPLIEDRWTWVSSFGPPSNLAPCTIRENVSFDNWPAPPLIGTRSNITEGFLANGPALGLVDTHGTEGPMQPNESYVPVGGTVVATQTYVYKCGTNAAVQLAGPHSIIRDVVYENGDWSFHISKNGQNPGCFLFTAGMLMGRCVYP